ncbi:MAG: hypothetical protein VCD00_21210 [Candidatus Hydrogenedentota bacterium]
MNDDELETTLSEQQLAEPSELHERRMQKLFDDTRKLNSTSTRRWSLRPWQAIAAAMLCVGLSTVTRAVSAPVTSPSEPNTVYIIESPDYPTFRPRPAMDAAFWANPPEATIVVRDIKGNPEVITIITDLSPKGIVQ